MRQRPDSKTQQDKIDDVLRSAMWRGLRGALDPRPIAGYLFALFLGLLSPVLFALLAPPSFEDTHLQQLSPMFHLISVYLGLFASSLAFVLASVRSLLPAVCALLGAAIALVVLDPGAPTVYYVTGRTMGTVLLGSALAGSMLWGTFGTSRFSRA